MTSSLQALIVGGGMITNDLLLPSIYHLQRTGIVGQIGVCALNSRPLRELRDNQEFRQAFPGQSFKPYPDFEEAPDNQFPELFKQALADLPPRQIVVVAMPDQLHYMVIREALKREQHVLCVKPLVLEYQQAVEIEREALARGLFIGIEYHKRFDRRSLIARRDYELGNFGEFVIGEAKMIEPYFYRFSNFQNWFTCDRTDPFVYVGCHYVDLVQFITRLKPVAVSVAGIEGKFPNGNRGYMWANGRVTYENGAILSVTDGLGYPDQGAGSNEQCLTMFCESENKSAMIAHDDQFRGVEHCYLEGIGCAGSVFNYINPDFYRLTPWEGEGYKPVGYGYDSVAATITTIQRIEEETMSMPEVAGLARRQQMIRQVDQKGIIATPANSAVNELVTEAARLSISNHGRTARIVHGENARVELT